MLRFKQYVTSLCTKDISPLFLDEEDDTDIEEEEEPVIEVEVVEEEDDDDQVFYDNLQSKIENPHLEIHFTVLP